MNAYLRPTAAIAADVLLPGDPGLAMELAQRLMVKPLMANHHHGLWGYSGRSEAGHELTVQAGGIGGPSTAAIVAELADLGAGRLIRIGRCAALDDALVPGQPVLVTSALGADGTTSALGTELTRPDGDLEAVLQRLAAGRVGELAVASFDLGADAAPAIRDAWTAAGIRAVDLETASLFALAARLGVAAAAALVVTESSAGDDAEEAVAGAALLELGELAGRALALSAEAVPG